MSIFLRKAVKTVGILSIPILLRVFFFEIYLIPSDSMRNTLISGDIVVVNKQSVGTRTKKDSSGLYKRTISLGGIDNGDVIVFNYPESDTVYTNRPDQSYYKTKIKHGIQRALADTTKFGGIAYVPVKARQPYVKRCIALPGDTLLISDRQVTINSMPFQESSEMIPGLYKEKKSPTNNKRIKAKWDFTWCFPHSKSYWWNFNYFGPLYVPRTGDTLDITTESIKLYRRIIRNYEYNELTVSDSSIYINKIKTSQYVVKQNYYFAMGDNRDGSVDSRVWGFVPEDHLIGKTKRILFSYDINNQEDRKIRWNRILRKID